MTDPFANRVSECRVAAILGAIGSPPNRREVPRTDDLQGPYDFWFDGGACRLDTGTATYAFADGTEARLATPASWLWVDICFPEGQAVHVVQQRQEATQPCPPTTD